MPACFGFVVFEGLPDSDGSLIGDPLAGTPTSPIKAGRFRVVVQPPVMAISESATRVPESITEIPPRGGVCTTVVCHEGLVRGEHAVILRSRGGVPMGCRSGGTAGIRLSSRIVVGRGDAGTTSPRSHSPVRSPRDS